MHPKILHLLARKRDPSRTSLWLLKRLINQDNINTALSRKSHHTLLIVAAKKGNSATVQALIDAGAGIEAKDNEDMTALHWAAYLGRTETVLTLLNRGAGIEAKITKT